MLKWISAGECHLIHTYSELMTPEVFMLATAVTRLTTATQLSEPIMFEIVLCLILTVLLLSFVHSVNHMVGSQRTDST